MYLSMKFPIMAFVVAVTGSWGKTEQTGLLQLSELVAPQRVAASLAPPISRDATLTTSSFSVTILSGLSSLTFFFSLAHD